MPREIMKSMGQSAGYDELMEASQNTPLQPHILNTFPPSKFSTPSLQKYDGSTDPHDHICQYKQVLLGCNIPPAMMDEMLCKLFSQSLKEPVLRWYCNLPPGSIGKFEQLNKVFMDNYAVHIHSGKTAVDL